MKMILRIFGIIIFLCVLLFLGTCAWQNCRQNPPAGPTAPNTKYEIIVKSTNNHYYADRVTTIGNGDSQVVTMQGFFEVIKGKYVLKNITLSLDERIFGEIEVKLK